MNVPPVAADSSFAIFRSGVIRITIASWKSSQYIKLGAVKNLVMSFRLSLPIGQVGKGLPAMRLKKSTRKMPSKKAPMAKLSPASASRIRMKAKSIMGLPKGDKDSAAGAAT